MGTGGGGPGGPERASDHSEAAANDEVEFGFFVRGDNDFPDGKRDGNFRPPLRRQILHLLPMAVRYMFHWVNMVVFKKKVPSIDAVGNLSQVSLEKNCEMLTKILTPDPSSQKPHYVR